MKLSLTFTMDNEAFHPAPGFEAHRLLEEVAQCVLDCETGGTIIDANGNKVGEWAIDDELPLCALAMGCLCACHAAGMDTSEPCDTDEERARAIVEGE